MSPLHSKRDIWSVECYLIETLTLKIKAAGRVEPHPVKRTEKKYKVFPVSSQVLLAAFYAAR